jgi:flagellar biosynthesis protein FlhA
MFVAGGVMLVLAAAPGLPLLPFAVLGIGLLTLGGAVRQAGIGGVDAAVVLSKSAGAKRDDDARDAVKQALLPADIELTFGKQISGALLRSNDQLAQRVGKLRRNFARQYGIVVPEIRLTDDVSVSPKRYEIKIHGTIVAAGELRLGQVLVVLGDGAPPDVPGEETREPAFGMRAMWFPELFLADLRRQGFDPVDTTSVLLTHVAEVIRGNLSQLLSYKSMRLLTERLDPEYRKLLDEIAPAHISYSGLQSVLKLLLAERISIRNLHLVLEAIAEIAPFTRKIEQIGEHARVRMAPQICGDLAQNGILKVLRMGSRWETAFHQAIKRDAKGEIVEFDINPKQIELFGTEASVAVRRYMDEGHQFCIVCAAESRPYVRMVLERLFPTLAILSHVEIARSIEVQALGAIS